MFKAHPETYPGLLLCHRRDLVRGQGRNFIPVWRGFAGPSRGDLDVQLADPLQDLRLHAARKSRPNQSAQRLGQITQPYHETGPEETTCHPTRSNHHKASASGRSSPWPVLKLGGDPKDCQVVGHHTVLWTTPTRANDGRSASNVSATGTVAHARPGMRAMSWHLCERMMTVMITGIDSVLAMLAAQEQ